MDGHVSVHEVGPGRSYWYTFTAVLISSSKRTLVKLPMAEDNQKSEELYKGNKSNYRSENRFENVSFIWFLMIEITIEMRISAKLRKK